MSITLHVHVESHWEVFEPKHKAMMDMAAGLIAADIERMAKQKVPVDTGQLLASIRHQRVDKAHFIATAGENSAAGAYARYQEFGGDGTRTVKNYTKAGTGAHYLRDGGDTVAEKAVEYIKTAARAHGI